MIIRSIALRCLGILAGFFLLMEAHAANWIRVPSDYATVSEAIRALAPAGGEIYVSGQQVIGGFAIGSTSLGMTWNSDAELTIEGDGTVVVNKAVHVYDNTGVPRALTLRGLRFEVDIARPNYSLVGAYAAGMRLRIENCDFHWAYGTAIRTDNVPDVGIDNCRFSCFGSSVSATSLDHVSRLSWTGSFFGRDPGAGCVHVININSTAGDYIGIANNVVVTTRCLNLALNTDVERIELLGNELQIGGVTIQASQRGRMLIAGNRVSAMGITMDSAAGEGRVCDILDNQIAETPFGGNSGFYIYDKQNRSKWRVIGNTFRVLNGTPSFKIQDSNQALRLPAGQLFFQGNNVQLRRRNQYGFFLSHFHLSGAANLSGNYWDHAQGPEVINSLAQIGVVTGTKGSIIMVPEGTVVAPWSSQPLSTRASDYLPSEPITTGLPQVRVEARPPEGPLPLTVVFSGNATGGRSPYRYRWEIDGAPITTVTTPALTWRFTTAETHVARLTVTDAAGVAGCAAALVNAGLGSNQISGKVTDQDTAQPLAGATLSLREPAGRTTLTARSDTWGEYAFSSVPTGNYALTARAPEHREENVTLTLGGTGERRRQNFALVIPLGTARKEVKQGLINQLRSFPAVTGSAPTSGTLAPYAAVEADAQQWLNSQSAVTERLQRLELAELAAADCADQAVQLASGLGSAVGSLTNQLVDAIFAIKAVTNFVNNRLPAFLGLNQLLEKLTAQHSGRILVVLYQRLGSGFVGFEGRIAINKILETILREINKQYGPGYYLRVGNWIPAGITGALLAEYGTRTQGALAEAVRRARAGGPYALPLDDTRELVRVELESAHRKTAIYADLAARYQTMGNFVWWFRVPTATIGSIIEGVDLNQALVEIRAVIKGIEMTLRGLEMETSAGRIWSLHDRLAGSLPVDLENAIYASFGDVGRRGGSGKPALGAMRLERVSGFKALRSASLPSSGTLTAALAACRAAVVAGNVSTLENALKNQFGPAFEVYEAQAAGVQQRLEPRLPSASVEADTLHRFVFERMLRGQIFIPTAVDYALRASQLNRTGAQYLALRAETLARLDALVQAIGNWNAAARQAQAIATGGAPLAGVVAVREARFLYQGQPAVTIQSTPQSLSLAATVENVGDLTVQNVKVAVGFFQGSQLALSGSPTTRTLATLAPGEQTTVTWNMRYQGPLYGRVEYARVELKNPDPAAPTFSEGAPAFALIATRPFPDADHDGMDDTWEQLNGLNSSKSTDNVGDLDKDGLSNVEEFYTGTNPRLKDSDGDGMSDGFERAGGLNPILADGALDPDGDGLTNAREFAAGTNPQQSDSDGDGYNDGLEVAAGTLPGSAASTPGSRQRAMAVREALLGRWLGIGTAEMFQLDVVRDDTLNIVDLIKLLKLTP